MTQYKINNHPAGGPKKAAAEAAQQPAAPSTAEYAALQAAKAKLEAQLVGKTQQLARASADVLALQAQVAALEAQTQRDAAILRDMTRQYLSTWSSKAAAAAGT